MMFGIALLGLLGIALVVEITDDDDDDTSTTSDEPGNPEGTREEGTEDADLLDTGGGDDTVFGGEGDDALLTGTGDDRAFGGDGGDLVLGEQGDDFLRGGANDDFVNGGLGEDTLFGDAGNDALDGTDVIDIAGIFEASRQAAADEEELDEDDLAAFIDPSREMGEADTLNGGVGDDILIAGSNDVVSTGTGSDEVSIGDWVIPGEPVEIVDFDVEEDTIVYNFVEGTTPPNVTFGETDDGLSVVLADEEIIAALQGVDFQDLQNANPTILLVPF
ncbi:MAG: hypothetical protein AAGF36_16240 [Pseudomonadota bacterium]